MTKQYERAMEALDTAQSLDPNSTEVVGWRGFCLNYMGDREEAVQLLEKAYRLDPFPVPTLLLMMGITYRDAGMYDEAIEMCGRVAASKRDYIFAYTCLASAYSLSGQKDKAAAEAAAVLRIDPGYTLEKVSLITYKNPADKENLLTSLRNAGIP
jgi:tetratricopeptide (TPR) repeat protein